MRLRHVASVVMMALALAFGALACPALARADEAGGCEHTNVKAQDIAWTWKNATASASFHCDDCKEDITIAANVTSVLSGTDTVVLTASVNVGGHTFTHSTIMPATTATFEGDIGVESVSVYYQATSAVPDETDVKVAVARDYTSGVPATDGTGGVIFRVNLKTGYAVTDMTATRGTYGRIMTPQETGVAGIWCITRLNANTVIKITTKFILSPGWALYDGHYYYVERDSTIRTDGWASYNGDWYYLNKDGRVSVNSWIDYQGRTYFVASDGKALKGSWLKSGDDWYYFGSDGAAYTERWLSFKGAYYYFGSDSKLVRDSLVEYKDAWYYLGKDGKCVISGWVRHNDAYYYAGADGKIVVSDWIVYEGAYYYAGEDGKIRANTWVESGGSYYYVGEDGKALASSWLEYEGSWYYLGANGKPYENAWLNYKGSWYYFDDNGHPLASASITLDGVTYEFDAQGRCVKRTEAA